MQTFLPTEDLRHSAELLDNRRLGKQRVETKQILLALGVAVGDHDGKRKSRWVSHPAVKMWEGYEAALALYGWFCCREWTRRGFKDSLTPQFEKTLARLTGRSKMLSSGTSPDDAGFIGGDEKIPSPWWLGYTKLHSSHRSNLVRKDPSYYSAFFTEDGSQPYYWPGSSRPSYA